MPSISLFSNAQIEFHNNGNSKIILVGKLRNIKKKRIFMNILNRFFRLIYIPNTNEKMQKELQLQKSPETSIKVTLKQNVILTRLLNDAFTHHCSSLLKKFMPLKTTNLQQGKKA